EIRAETTTVDAAHGLPAPDFVFANDGDNAYGLVMLDARSATWLETHIQSVNDPFRRAMLWGALWDLVRDARLAPSTFISAALRALPLETDEQIASGMITRVNRALGTYLSVAQRDSIGPEVERALLVGAGDPSRPYGIRKDELDAYIGVARTADAKARLAA